MVKKTSQTEEISKGIVLTPEGYEKVLKELEHLKQVRRKEVAELIREAKQFGEFIENSEYERAKSDQSALEGKIIELERILQYGVVVEGPKSKPKKVVVGSVVKVRETDSKEEFEYKIVGPVEADPGQSKISNESPVGQALLGSKVGDTCSVTTPNGSSVSYKVLNISK